MKKSFLILSFLSLMIVSLCVYYVKVNETRNRTDISLEKAFKDSGASLAGSEVYFWAELKGKLASKAERETLLKDITSSTGIMEDESFSRTNMENEELEKVQTSGFTSDKRKIDVVISIGKDMKASNEKYISINITQEQSFDQLEETKNKISEVLKSRGLSPRVNTCITGTFAGKLDSTQVDSISRKVLRETDARKVEGIRDGSFTSVSAYTPYVEPYIRVNGRKVNLNIALRYNSYEDKTYIWLATPVITTEY